jgi:cobalt-zinc-cadmium efflux system membrane fusion protein
MSHEQTRSMPAKPTLKSRAIAGGIVGIAAIAIAVFVFRSGKETGGDAATEAGAGEPGESTEVHLNAEKLRFAEIELAKSVRQPIRETRVVPGKLTYDAARYLEITAPVECVVREVLVEPGQVVAQGTRLVTLSSAAIGKARDEYLQRQAEWRIARDEHRWSESIYENVEQLLGKLSVQTPLDQLEKQLETRALGDYRERLVAAYSKLLFAQRVISDSDELGQKGVLSKRLLEERRSNLEVAAATFKGACESARFEAMRDHSKAHAAEMQALRVLAISRDNLSVLLGPQGVLEATDAEAQPDGDPQPDAKSSEAAASDAGKPNTANPEPASATPSAAAASLPPVTPPSFGESSKNLSEFAVQAPFAGRIERRVVVRSARIEAGKPLFVLADTAKLWVEAEIHERDWAALEHASEGEIAIRVPALGEQAFATRTRYIGAEVSSASRSVPLVTEVDNTDGRLKPGMFVWVEAPLGKVRDACVVPAGAIMRHEGQAFVFVPMGGDRFRRVDVQTGLETREHIEIRSGLEPGQEVVSRGAFYLKSELLLEKEAD